MSHTNLETRGRIVAHLIEGNSIRSVERLLGVHRDTVMRLGNAAGAACARLHAQRVRNLRPKYVEGDEIWTFVRKKQGHRVEGDPPEWGDQYTYLACDANTKLVISYLTDKRGEAATHAFLQDLRARTLDRFQFTSDGYKPYVAATEAAFGSDVDFAQIIKDYSSDAGPGAPAERRYSPGRITGMQVHVRQGNPDPAHISTSYAERLNLSVRTSLRRFVRLSLGFSKKAANLRHAVALFVGYFNWCRVHETLRVTPAMQSGLTDHVWTIEELLVEAEAAPEPWPPRGMRTGPLVQAPPGAAAALFSGYFREGN